MIPLSGKRMNKHTCVGKHSLICVVAPFSEQPACVELLQKPDCLQSGWMTKLGHIVKNWKRRYFVLTRGCLYYFKGPDVSPSLFPRFSGEPIRNLPPTILLRILVGREDNDLVCVTPQDWGTTGQIPLLNVHAERVQHQVSPLCFAVITDHPNVSLNSGGRPSTHESHGHRGAFTPPGFLCEEQC